MAEQTFRSPGFFEREIDATARETPILGVPAGVVGTAEKGPAFVPVTVGSLSDFLNKFGDLDPDRAGPYAVSAFLQNRAALTYMRVLGAGANSTTAHIGTTRDNGTVVNAGFKITPMLQIQSVAANKSAATGGGTSGLSAASMRSNCGAVQMLVAKHYVSGNTDYSMPQFIDNPSFVSASSNNTANLVRGVIFSATGSRVQLYNVGQQWNNNMPQEANARGTSNKYFALAISSSLGSSYTDEFISQAGSGVKIMTASLDPSDDAYIGKVLNTDPLKFYEHQHLLYLDYAVEDEYASVDQTPTSPMIALLSGSSEGGANAYSTNQFLSLYGRYDTRFTTPRTPKVISQPYGKTEYPLFHFEALSDGAYANDKIKVTIANLRASANKNYQYGTFEVRVRRFDDTDLDPETLESYPDCSLDPNASNFVANKIGDYKARYNFDADNDDEKRIIVSGRYANKSNYIRIVIQDSVYNSDVPDNCLPFGFEGIPVLKTSDNLMDDPCAPPLSIEGVTIGNRTANANGNSAGIQRLNMTGSAAGAAKTAGLHLGLTGSIVPPLPHRFKITRGQVMTGSTVWATGLPGTNERVDGRMCWGVKYTRCPKTGSTDNAMLNPNIGGLPNPIIKAYAKFQGIKKSDVLVTGSGMNNFNANKFTLARVMLAGTGSTTATLLQHVSASAREHMLEAAYMRNGLPDSQTYAINDTESNANGDPFGMRVTFATLAQSSSVKFNRFTEYLKFNIPMYGGYDGLNILDKDMHLMNDKASSTDTSGENGKASGEFASADLGLAANPAGTGRNNNHIAAYREATRIMTDPMTVRHNILAIPGIRDNFVTDNAAILTRAYSMAMYLMDIPAWSEGENRLFGNENRSLIVSASSATPDVRETAEQFESRVVDNNYVAAYFPDVYITDSNTGKHVKVPASVAAMSALGYNDRVAYPWFAPAGFNRGGLGIVRNTDVRLTSADRDTLYDAKINPIANFSDGSFVIFGQKTAQANESALDRVNVRRMLLEVKRKVGGVANKILFEPNTPATRGRFINLVTPLLSTIQSQQGIESFKVVMDATNNSTEDVENNRLNGRIVVVPTRAIEFIAIDFIITNSGVSFE